MGRAYFFLGNGRNTLSVIRPLTLGVSVRYPGPGAGARVRGRGGGGPLPAQLPQHQPPVPGQRQLRALHPLPAQEHGGERVPAPQVQVSATALLLPLVHTGCLIQHVT